MSSAAVVICTLRVTINMVYLHKNTVYGSFMRQFLWVPSMYVFLHSSSKMKDCSFLFFLLLKTELSFHSFAEYEQRQMVEHGARRQRSVGTLMSIYRLTLPSWLLSQWLRYREDLEMVRLVWFQQFEPEGYPGTVFTSNCWSDQLH